MSSEAVGWAFKQICPSSSIKFTLVALCECANYKTGHIYPSIAHLQEITGQDRKTLIANIAKLEQLGLLVDTGERSGRTGQIKVYRATMKGAQIERQDSHYVYKLSDSDGRYYIGVRSCVCLPEDDSYMGSGVWPRACAAHGIELTKAIVSTHASRSDAEIAEALMIKAAIGDHSCMNIEYKNTEKGIPKTEPFNSNSSVFPPKQSQKRDTEPSREPSVDKAKALPTARVGKTIIPEDWELPAVSELPPKARACAEQWTRASYETHGEAFVNYWRSARKMMADWRARWADRVIALHSQVMRDQKYGNAPVETAPKAQAKPMTPAELRRAIEFNRTTGNDARADELAKELARLTGPPNEARAH